MKPTSLPKQDDTRNTVILFILAIMMSLGILVRIDMMIQEQQEAKTKIETIIPR